MSTGASNDVAGKQDEFSGLHEIKALAASAVARRSKERRAETDPGDDTDSLIVSASPVALSNVLLPQPGKEVAPPKVRATSVTDADGVPAAPITHGKASRAGLYVGALGLAAAAAAIGLYLKQAPSGASAVQAPVAVQEQAALPAGQPAPTPPPAQPTVAALNPGQAARPEAAPAEPAERKPEPAVVAETRSGERDEAKSHGDSKDADKAPKASKSKDADKDAKVAAGKDAKPAADAAKPAAPKNEIDDLFGDKPSEEKKAAAAGPALPEKLEQSDVKKGMGTVKARVQACYDEYKVPGTIKLKVKIEPDGSVSSADVVDQKFAGTETGACVSSAVKNARFPAVSGTSLVVSYPFILQ